MTISYIRRYLSLKKGSQIAVIYHGSRNHKEKYAGILDNIYSNIFTIKLPTGKVKCFTYIDVITKTIQIYI